MGLRVTGGGPGDLSLTPLSPQAGQARGVTHPHSGGVSAAHSPVTICNTSTSPGKETLAESCRGDRRTTSPRFLSLRKPDRTWRGRAPASLRGRSKEPNLKRQPRGRDGHGLSELRGLVPCCPDASTAEWKPPAVRSPAPARPRANKPNQ